MYRASLFLLVLLTLFSQSGIAQVSLPPSPADWIYQNETPGMNVGVAAPGDVNGDEFGDFLVSETGRVLLFLGSATGPAATPDWILSIEPDASVFVSDPVGDLNGDGFDEILLSDGRLYMGSSAGPASPPVQTGFIRSEIAAGDVNGDGYGDLAVRKAGGADVYHGSPSGIPATPSRSITGPRIRGVPVVEDVTGDGYDDLMLTSMDPPPGRQKYTSGSASLHTWKGGPSGLAQEEMRVQKLPGPEQIAALAGAGDANGDGQADLIAGMYCNEASCEDAPPIVALYGSPSGLHKAGDLMPGVRLREDSPISGVGDVNGDGYDDAAVGVDFPDDFNRSVLLIFFGSAVGFNPSPGVLRGEIQHELTEGDHFAWRAVGAGDVNGDGYADILVTSVWPAVFADGASGRASLFLGRPDLAATATFQEATASAGARRTRDSIRGWLTRDRDD